MKLSQKQKRIIAAKIVRQPQTQVMPGVCILI
jgi:hypothetical protein